MTEPGIININFRHDLVAILRTEFIRLGYDVSSIVDDIELIRIHFGVRRRLVSWASRQILKPKVFSCPPDYRNALASIECLVKNGNDLTPYLSKKIRQLDCNDSLLNDWGIHHLHLGTKVESDGFIERTDTLLYCRFETNQAYFIDILPHGNWAQQKLIKTMLENWPELFSRFQLKGILPGKSLTDGEIDALRKSQMSIPYFSEDGAVYSPVGGGVTSAGCNTFDVLNTSSGLCWARHMQDTIIKDFSDVEERARQNGVLFSYPAEFKLCLMDESFCAVEISSGYTLPLCRIRDMPYRRW